MNWPTLEDIARHELRGVGDPAAGEWVEHGDIALHLRRRLTAKEIASAGIVAVCDVRGTPEHAERIARLRAVLPLSMRTLPTEALL